MRKKPLLFAAAAFGLFFFAEATGLTYFTSDLFYDYDDEAAYYSAETGLDAAFASGGYGDAQGYRAGSGSPGGALIQTSAASPSAPRIDGIRFRRYSEQNENAYSFEAPEGWDVQSRLLRRSALEYRIWDVIASPDGKIRMVGGMPEGSVFIEPNAMTQQIGLSEGSVMPGTSMRIMRQQTPVDFGRQNMQAVAGSCANVQITGQQPRPDAAQQAVERAKRDGDWSPIMQFDAAEITFTCQDAGGPRQGSVTAVTLRMEVPGSGTTWIGSLGGYVATPDQADAADRIVKHMTRSTQSNPQWKAQQRQAREASQRDHAQRMAQRRQAWQAQSNAHQQRMAQNQRAFDARNQAWQAQQNANDRQHSQFIDNLRDETNVYNPSTGQSYKVESGYDTYWQSGDGTIVGTPGYVGNPDVTEYNPLEEGYRE